MLSKLSFFKDDVLSLKFIFGILIVKCIGCFAYYWVYFCYYPDGFNGDSASTLHDAKIMYDALPNHPTDYFKMVGILNGICAETIHFSRRDIPGAAIGIDYFDKVLLKLLKLSVRTGDIIMSHKRKV